MKKNKQIVLFQKIKLKKSFKIIFLIIYLLITGLCTTIVANTIDTITWFEPSHGYFKYSTELIQMQCARFVPNSAGHIMGVIIKLDGKKTNRAANLRIFGLETGAAIPYLEQDLMEPVTLNKQIEGVETISFMLNKPVEINSHQFFIGIDNVADDVSLVSDNRIRKPLCEGSEDYYRQCLKLKNGQWWTGQRGFAISVIFENNNDNSTKFIANIIDSSLSNINNRSLAVADINRDNYLDILINGKLLINQQSGGYVNNTAISELSEKPLANLFVDVNNDNFLDVVFVSNKNQNNINVFIQDTKGAFICQSYNIPDVLHPSGVALSDFNGDGYQDMFISQKCNDSLCECSDVMLYNDTRGGFFKDALNPVNLANTESVNSQLIDINNDNIFEIIIPDGYSQNILIWEKMNNVFHLKKIYNEMINDNCFGISAFNVYSDKKNEIVVSRDILRKNIKKYNAKTQSIWSINNSEKLVPSNNLFSNAQNRGLSVCEDFDNNGYHDILSLSRSECSYVDLFLQQENEFQTSTLSSGFSNVSLGANAVAADFNNDGLLDILSLSKEKLVLFENKSKNNYNFIELISNHINDVMGVEVYCGKEKYYSTNNTSNGTLMQNLSRIHIGLGNSQSVDSVLIYHNNRNKSKISNVSINKINAISDFDRFYLNTNLTVEVYPNPFAEQITFKYSVYKNSPVLLEIYAANGMLVEKIIDDIQLAGNYSIDWFVNRGGTEGLSQGLYLYRLQVGEEQTYGVLVHNH